MGQKTRSVSTNDGIIHNGGYQKSNEGRHFLQTMSRFDTDADIDSRTRQLDGIRHTIAGSAGSGVYRPFTILPTEVILNIAEFLDQAAQVLLSLTCKYFCSCLSSCLSLPVTNLSTRTSILLCIEVDHPEYLTCRACGWMYIWQRTRQLNFTCPRSKLHPSVVDKAMRNSTVCVQHSIFMNRAIRDLILRAYHRGPQHGLPTSFLNTNCLADDQVSCKVTARVVNDELILASTWSLDLGPNDDVGRNLYLLHQGMCLHRWDSTTDFFGKIILSNLNRGRLKEPITEKCCYCATDYKALTTDLEDGGVRILLAVWQNYGDGFTERLDTKQLFHTKGRPKLLPLDPLSNPTFGDIEALFKSQQGDPEFGTECQHGEADELTHVDEYTSVWDAGREFGPRVVRLKAENLH